MSEDLIKRSDAIGACAYETIECYEARKAIRALPSAEPKTGGWIPCSERLPSEEDCPMDCMVTRRGKFMGNYVDMAVAERNGTWTHEDWTAIVLGDVESGRKTGLISTRDDEIIAWMPLPPAYKEETDE
jgi:hypothetical protein